MAWQPGMMWYVCLFVFLFMRVFIFCEFHHSLSYIDTFLCHERLTLYCHDKLCFPLETGGKCIYIYFVCYLLFAVYKELEKKMEAIQRPWNESCQEQLLFSPVSARVFGFIADRNNRSRSKIPGGISIEEIQQVDILGTSYILAVSSLHVICVFSFWFISGFAASIPSVYILISFSFYSIFIKNLL